LKVRDSVETSVDRGPEGVIARHGITSLRSFVRGGREEWIHWELSWELDGRGGRRGNTEDLLGVLPLSKGAYALIDEGEAFNESGG
jgi:hypothetical protein